MLTMAATSDANLTKEERLKKIRLALNLTQKEFGEAIGRAGGKVDQNYVARLENQRANLGPDVQERIEKRFNVNHHYFETGIGEMFNEKPTPEQLARISQSLQATRNLTPKGGNLIWVSAREVGLFLRTDDNEPTLNRAVFPMLTEPGYGFEVSENNMLPEFPSGTYAICTRLAGPDDMVSGRAYFVQTGGRLLLGRYDGRDEDGLNFAYTYPAERIGFAMPESDIKYIYHVEFKMIRS